MTGSQPRTQRRSQVGRGAEAGQASPPEALDADVILAAQELEPTGEAGNVVVATTNPGHLRRFVDVRDWREMRFQEGVIKSEAVPPR